MEASDKTQTVVATTMVLTAPGSLAGTVTVGSLTTGVLVPVVSVLGLTSFNPLTDEQLESLEQQKLAKEGDEDGELLDPEDIESKVKEHDAQIDQMPTTTETPADYPVDVPEPPTTLGGAIMDVIADVLGYFGF